MKESFLQTSFKELYMLMTNQFQKKVYMYYPDLTIPISVTGTFCQLRCKHCSGHCLKFMKTIPDIQHLIKNNGSVSSFLISGGCDVDGAVPLAKNLDLLKKLREKGFKLNLHTGLLPPDEIALVAPLANNISFDFVVDDKTIREVHGIKRTGKDYINTFLQLRKIAPVVPHITVGLRGGKIYGEKEAVKELARIGCEKIIFLVFIPTRGTPYQNCHPPSLGEVEKVFSHTREIMPDTSSGIGCMYPRGNYKIHLEMLGYKYGFNSFVNPSKKFKKFLEDNEVKIVIKRECCSL